MKKILVLFMPLFIISCALESEDTDTLYGKFAFTIAEAGIDNISNVAMNESNTGKKICIPYSNAATFNYHAVSKGMHGSTNDVNSLIRNSYIQSLSTKIYFYYDCTSSTNCKNISVDVKNLPYLKYNETVSDSHVIDISAIDIVADKEYLVSIIINGRELSGNGNHTVERQFGSDFGTVIFSDNCAKYQ